MPLQIPSILPQALDALQTTLGRWTSQPALAPRVLHPLLQSGQPNGIGLSSPHEVFTLSVTDAASANPLSKAHSIGWRVILSNTGGVAWMDLFHDPATRTPAFSGVTRTPLAKAMEDFLLASQRDARVIAGDYALAVLDVPSLYLRTLWYKSQKSTDLFIPFAVPGPEFTPGKIYEKPAFLSTLQSLAQRRLASAATAGVNVCG